MIESIETTIQRTLARSTRQQELRPGTRIMDAYWTLQQRQDRPSGVRDVAPNVVRGRIFESRWIADCCYCTTAMPISLSDPRWWCINPACCNGGIMGADGAAIPIQLPAPLEIMRIEALLVLRSRPDLRHWTPGESFADLIRENREPPQLKRLRNLPPLPSIGLERVPDAIRALMPRWVFAFGADVAATINSEPPEAWA